MGRVLGFTGVMWYELGQAVGNINEQFLGMCEYLSSVLWMEGESLVEAEGLGFLVRNPYMESTHKPGTAFSTLL